MTKLLAGLTLVFVLQIGFVGSARAAEIPPTDECVATFKGSLKTLVDATDGVMNPKRTKAAQREFAATLADADCVTDAEPLIKKVKAEPWSERCAVAARSAGEFWGPAARRVNLAKRGYSQRQARIQRRSFGMFIRIFKARERGASKKKIRKLVKERQKLNRQGIREYQSFMRHVRKVIGPQRFAIALTFYEFASLRCFGFYSVVSSDNAPKDPVGRLLTKDWMTVYSAIYFAYIDSGMGSRSSSDAGLASALPLESTRQLIVGPRP